jgi:hypothetical protein
MVVNALGRTTPMPPSTIAMLKRYADSGTTVLNSPSTIAMLKRYADSGTTVLNSPSTIAMLKQFSRAESERVNQVLALSGVFPRVAPTELQIALNATLVDHVGGSDVLAFTKSTNTIERKAARRIAQIVTAVILCLWMADLSLSENEIVKVVFRMVSAMALFVPGINVYHFAGLVFDFLRPPDD